MSFEQDDIIGEKYKVIKKIGAGSFGTIYLGMYIYYLTINILF